MMSWIAPAVVLPSLLMSGVTWWVRARAKARHELTPVVRELEAATAAIESLSKRCAYVKASERLSIVETSNRSLARTRTHKWKLFATSAQRTVATAVGDFVMNSERIVSDRNKRFVDAEMQNYAALFDRMESYPLTEAQRRACVVNDDTNLVLAGAGTGKTSTMVGRAGYLLASSRAHPNDLLMLAYGGKAADEMKRRISERTEGWGLSAPPKVKTFHALGLEIIGAVEGKRPDVSRLATDGHSLRVFVDTVIMKLSDSAEYREKIIRYLGSEQFPYRNPFDFSSLDEYYEYVRTNELRTLRKELVKSFEECVIANFLNANSVQYEYERPYEIDTAGPDYRQYRPDFFLPDYGIYIEHFALDSNGLPPSHFDQEKYLAGVKWKRELHSTQGTRLVETYSYLKRSGILEEYLGDQLKRFGVELKPRSSKEILEELRDGPEVSELAHTLCDFLVLFRQSEYQMSELVVKAQSDIDSTRLMLLLELFAPVLREYKSEMDRNGEIDFAEMIRRAIVYVESGKYKSPYVHIMIDEFQDISALRARLLAVLSDQHSNSDLFMVGDDWQSIYRFTGSDISYMRDYKKHYEHVAITPLDLTFRFNEAIARVSSSFVLTNPNQIKKTIRSNRVSSEPAISTVRVVLDEDGLNIALDAIVGRSEREGRNRSTVLVLGRYHFVFDGIDMREARRRHTSLDIQEMTVHAAKGKEADYVIILGLKRGKYGFPCEKPDDTVLAFLLPQQEQFEFAEERRLFYVAMTRARHRVYLVYNPEEPSRFVQELLSKEHEPHICTDEIPHGLVLEDRPTVPCPSCRNGILVLRRGDFGPFAGCNNFPRCRYTEPVCPQCGGLMRRNGMYRECTTPGCDVRVPICSRCGGAMVERMGPYGHFWGCINYRGKEEHYSCTFTMKIR